MKHQTDAEDRPQNPAPAAKEAVGAEDFFPPSWEELFEDLYEFQKENGHFEAPSDDPDFDELIQFVKSQREAYQKRRKSALQIEHEELLDKIGFIWSPHATAPARPTPSQSSRRRSTKSAASARESSSNWRKEDLVCPDCDKRFSSVSGVTYHVRTAVCTRTKLSPSRRRSTKSAASARESSSNGRKEDLVCPDCDKNFSSVSGFIYHVRTGVCKRTKSTPPPSPARMGLCCVAGCRIPAEGRRSDYMCTSHYSKAARGPVKNGTTTRLCRIEHCTKASQGRRTDFMCLAHYKSFLPTSPVKPIENNSAQQKRKSRSTTINASRYNAKNGSSGKKQKFVGR